MQDNPMNPADAHAIRYLSHHDNRYLRFFKGHKQVVTSLSMSPKSDHFVSTSLVRPCYFVSTILWDVPGILLAPLWVCP